MNDQPRLELWKCAELVATLRGLVGRMFGHRLEELHEWPHLHMIPGDVSRETDNLSRAHQQFYRLFPRIEPYYRRVASELGRRILGGAEPFYVQRVPTFRVHFPRSRAVGEPHTDWQYGHQIGEVSFWVPLTRATNSATMWVAERAQGWTPEEYAKTYKDKGSDAAFETLPEPVKMWPINTDLGTILVWDSVLRAHGNLLNREALVEMLHLGESEGGQVITADQGAELVAALGAAGEHRPLKVQRTWLEGSGVSRVSVDFRVLPAHLAEAETERHAVNTGVAMALDRPDRPGYWTEPWGSP